MVVVGPGRSNDPGGNGGSGIVNKIQISIVEIS